MTAVLLPATLGSAEEPRVYDLAACVRIGLEQSVKAANARRDEAIAGQKIRQARADALPHITATASYLRLDELQDIEFDGERMEFGTLDNYQVGIEVAQLLYSGGRVAAALRAARLTQSLAGHERNSVETGLIRDIETGFYDILLARESVAVREASLKQLEALVQQTDDRFKNGTASEFDLIRAKVRRANERPFLIRARNRRDVAIAAYRRLLRLPDGPIAFHGKLACEAVKGDLAAFQRAAALNNPDLKAVSDSVGLRKEDLGAARSAGRPSIQARVLYTGANSYQFVSFDEDWEWHWNAGVSLNWNLWDGDLTRGRVEEKRLVLEKARATEDDLTRGLRLQVQEAYLDMRHAEEAVTSAEQNLELARKSLNIAQARHKNGLGTYLEFTDANLALSTARLTHLEALGAHMKAVSRLRFLCGSNLNALGKEQP
jgi:HAE1 family hydrophobic/amphiphilic exporter-1